MKVDVYLPSGDACSIEVSPATPVSELKNAAQRHFQRRLRLTAKGRQLDLTATLSEAGLQDGDMVTAVVQLGEVAAAHKVFAWHGHGAEVVTWGKRGLCRDGAPAQRLLNSVRHIKANAFSFAAILESGAVVTWRVIHKGAETAARWKSS